MAQTKKFKAAEYMALAESQADYLISEIELETFSVF